jgi:DNA-binding response OmpR family regulator
MLSLVKAVSSTSMGPIRILVVEDERKMREAIAKAVRLEGWQAAEATGGAEGMKLLTSHPFDLVLLDWMLPDRDGLELLGEMRGLVANVPVLMLTARGTVADKVTGLDKGADDYLAKPFSMVELVARCRALLRRPIVTATELTCGDLKLIVRARCLQRGAEEIPLTPQETDLLECLLSRPGQIVTRDMLEAVVWKGARRFTSRDNILDVLISRIRQKIETPASGRLIHTLRGLGYRVTR